MYLKSIEAVGFKSFADKLKITLDNETTCIVGPNGSGKSNVVDAVRWVLGEQSVKSLRGSDAMSDVIFSGSKSRNPLNVASVTLTFDNSDQYLNVPYSEVAIKRRVYRTGENEYFLNGEKCRLKDITDLLLDSGIGKESFNIIGQGEVQKIINSNPAERRSIFEEAAGVLKYKKRKEEAIKKLDRTKDNMDRVEDIIAELEVQVKPLEEQSKKAQIYLSTKEALKNCEVALLAHEIGEMTSSSTLYKGQIEKLQEEILTLNTKTNNSKLESLKLDLLHTEEALTAKNRELLEKTRQEEKLNGQKNMLQERAKYQATDSRVHEQIIALNESKLSLQNEIQSLELEIASIGRDIDLTMKKIHEVEQEEISYTLKRESLQKESATHDRELLSTNNRIAVLKEFIESGGGLSQAVKSVLNHPGLKGIHDVLGNLIQVPDEYTKALEISLGGAKEFIVCETDQNAKDAIRYLKSSHLGRATFFPISVITPRNVDNNTLREAKTEPGFIGVLSSLVTYDAKYAGVVENQIGNVLVCDDIDSANRLSNKIHARYKIVTTDGDVVHIGGSLTGGSYRNTRSMISDRNELEKLVLKSRDLENILVSTNEELTSLDEKLEKYETVLKGLKSVLFEQQEQKSSKEASLTKKKNDLSSKEEEWNSLNHLEENSLSEEEERLMKEYYEVVREKEQIQLEIKNHTKERERLQVEIQEAEAENKLTSSTLRAKESELKDLEIKTSRLEVSLDNELQTLSEEYELTYEKAKELYPLEMEADEARSKVNAYKVELRNLGVVNLAAIEEYERVSGRYEFLWNQKEDLEKAKQTLLEIIEEMDSVMKDEFSLTFQKIQKEFSEVFKELFKGGKATLTLTNPDDLLTTGIDITASPPGKKLSNISLLSGGEKTLTAISLLFAILNVRTVPFCLFDEVEAALDEANVDNFGEYLDHYKNKTQFLLITHKKKTMEYANTLYGITMQESGVSKLVSVKLSDK